MFRSVGDRFDMGKSSLEVCFQRIISALEQLSPTVIKWPTSCPSTSQSASATMGCTYGFPNTIGAIDGTHVPIKAPNDHGEAYVNRKKTHSIVLQAVCNHEMKFIDCFAGYPGSVHDARILRNSPLFLDAQSNYSTWFPNNSHLVGDAAYPLKKWIMVPYRDNGHLTNAQKLYNTKLSITRSVIERAFALLKGRFRRLKMLDMNRTDLIAQCIIACCVLHNLCLANSDAVPDDIDDTSINSAANEVHGHDQDLTDSQDHHLANQKRTDITNMFQYLAR